MAFSRQMDLASRIGSFITLGQQLGRNELRPLVVDPLSNPWFTGREINRACKFWAGLLTWDNLLKWTGPYRIPDDRLAKNVLVIPAANLPLVGFHDFLSVLITGNRYIGQVSSRDNQLLPAVADALIAINPEFRDKILFSNQPQPADGVIATGNNNTARYFDYKYRSVPSVIRKNRSSAAVLTGRESPADYAGLTADILEYYGLGCRSVSHVFMPSGLPTDALVSSIENFSDWDDNQMLRDNLRFQKARLTLMKLPFTDAGKIILCENHSLHSPIGMVHYSYLDDDNTLDEWLNRDSGELQCIVGTNRIPFGSAQKPALWDYADRIDVVRFLINLGI